MIKAEHIGMIPKTNLISVGGALNTDDRSYTPGYFPGMPKVKINYDDILSMP